MPEKWTNMYVYTNPRYRIPHNITTAVYIRFNVANTREYDDLKQQLELSNWLLRKTHNVCSLVITSMLGGPPEFSEFVEWMKGIESPLNPPPNAISNLNHKSSKRSKRGGRP